MTRLMSRFLLVVAGCLLPMAAQAQQPERRWEFQLAGLFKSGEFPMYLYGRERGGEWVAGVGSSRHPATGNKKTFNRSFYFGDLSAVPIKDGKMKGRIVVHMTPDQWVPKDHQSFPLEIDVDAALVDGKMEGSYKVVAVNSNDPTAAILKDRAGKIVGISKEAEPLVLPRQFTLQLKLQGLLVGGPPTAGDRCLVLQLGFDGDKIVSAEQGRLSDKQALISVAPFGAESVAVKVTSDGFKGRVVVASTTLDLEPATYAIDVDGRILDKTFVGSYVSVATVEGKPAVTVNGSFDGVWSPGSVPTVAAKPDTRPWWVPVKGYQPVQPGEHPRLLFRKSDVPALRKKAETPEGKALVARLRRQLNGGDGETMPTSLSNAKEAYDKNTLKKMPLGTYTMSHAAGYGMLFQLTGDKKYADLGLQCFELAFKGVRDRDDRYAWDAPGGALRQGPTLGMYAIAYDLCYDGWDEATRQRIGKAIENYNAGREKKDGRAILDLEAIARGTMPPGSNHFGMEIGGAALVLLAISGEPWADQKRIDRLLKLAESGAVRNLTEGFGDGGFFAEGDGTGYMSSHIAFLAGLQAWKNATGRDYFNAERPNARMMALKWIYLTVAHDGRLEMWPIRGGYGHNVALRHLSGGGYFGLGIGAVTEEQKAAVKWYYNHFVAAHDERAGGPLDTVSDYPISTIYSLVNWPLALPERNPAEVLPLCYRDSIHGFYAWRNRWQDGDDVVITALTKPTHGYMSAKADTGLQVLASGKKFSWGQVGGETKHWWTSPRGEASVLTTVAGKSIAVDFTKASGADVMLATTGKAEGTEVTLGGIPVTFKFLTPGPEPKVTVDGATATIGRQTVTVKDGNIVLSVTK